MIKCKVYWGPRLAMTSIVITVVRDAEGLQPIETYGHTSDADAEAHQILAPAQSRLQEHRERGPTRGIETHGKIFIFLSISALVHEKEKGRREARGWRICDELPCR